MNKLITAIAIVSAILLGFLYNTFVVERPTNFTDSRCEEASSVPWVEYLSNEGDRYSAIGELLTFRGSGSQKFCLKVAGKGIFFLDGIVPVYLAFNNGNYLLMGRELGSGYLSLSTLKGQEFVKLEIPSQMKEFQIEGKFTLGDDFYFFAYDPSTHVASGAGLTTTESMLSMVKISPSSSPAGFKVSNLGRILPGGLDEVVFTSQLGSNQALLCQENQCWKFSNNDESRNPSYFLLPMKVDPTNSRIVELTAKGNEAAFLLESRSGTNQIEYQICRITFSNEGERCQKISSRSIPFDLQYENNYDLKISSADEVSKVEQLFILDLQKSKSGVGQLGSGNFEGRIAWSTVYFVSALLDLIHSKELTATMRDDLESRLVIEINILCDTVTSSNSLKSKRYSLDRSEEFFLIQISRVLQILNRASSEMANPNVCLGKTIEKLTYMAVPGVVSIEEYSRSSESVDFDELKYRKGASFWADGSNVPFNYQSAWISAIASSEKLLEDEQISTVAGRILQRFWNSTSMEDKPAFWGYSDGVFLKGWTVQDRVSTNTPEYIGASSLPIADVSYRTMDIIALVQASNNGLIDLPEDFNDYILSLVERDLLWPFVLEVFEFTDIPSNCQNSTSFSRYARSNVHYYSQSQVWSLFDIGKTEIGRICSY